jgi:hypothetical protein
LQLYKTLIVNTDEKNKQNKMDKKEYISNLAAFLVSNNNTMAGNELAQHLNRNNYKTSYGDEYQGKRGTYTLLQATYNWLASVGRHQDASNVALAFPKPNGHYAYDKT